MLCFEFTFRLLSRVGIATALIWVAETLLGSPNAWVITKFALVSVTL